MVGPELEPWSDFDGLREHPRIATVTVIVYISLTTDAVWTDFEQKSETIEIFQDAQGQLACVCCTCLDAARTGGSSVRPYRGERRGFVRILRQA